MKRLVLMRVAGRTKSVGEEVGGGRGGNDEEEEDGEEGEREEEEEKLGWEGVGSEMRMGRGHADVRASEKGREIWLGEEEGRVGAARIRFQSLEAGASEYNCGDKIHGRSKKVIRWRLRGRKARRERRSTRAKESSMFSL